MGQGAKFHPRASMKSRSSSSTYKTKTKSKKAKDCCRKFITFMCTQVGVGGLILGYAIVGAFCFMNIETYNMTAYNNNLEQLMGWRKNMSLELWQTTEYYTTLNETAWKKKVNSSLVVYQNQIAKAIRDKMVSELPTDVWNFPASLMYSMSIFTMIGYGNTAPQTLWGKLSTMVYATFGIPLYVLYFLNIGRTLAKTFKWLYTRFHECTRYPEDDIEDCDVRTGAIVRKKIIVPSTACLWVISFYILIGTIMFAEWENWSYLDSIYFCVTSLCKIGFGDFVPGADILDLSSGKEKLGINFIYMLLGMGLVAMCYNLMREDVKMKISELKEDTRLCFQDLRLRCGTCCGDTEKVYYDSDY